MLTTVIRWIVIVLIAVVVYVIAKWLVPELFGAFGIDIPADVAKAIAALIALLVVLGGWKYGGTL